jgi:PAS domain S-box-containing protein
MRDDETNPTPSRATGWRRLIDPHPSITSAEERRKARLSSVVTLILLVVGVPYLVATYLTTLFGSRVPITSSAALSDVGALCFIALAYGLSRTKKHQVGILLAATMMNIAIFALWFEVGAEGVAILYYLVVGLIISSGVLEFRISSAFAAANVGLVLGLTFVERAKRPDLAPEYLYVVFFLVVCALLLQAGGYMFQLDQRRLEERTRQLALSEGRFRALAENLPEAVFITEPDFSKTHYASPGFTTIWGRRREELYANPMAWLEGIRPDDRKRIQANLASPNPRNSETVFHVVQPDGSERSVRARTFSILGPDKRPVLAAGIAEDITVFDEAQRVLRESNERLKQTEQFRLRMIQTVSHDLQGPLSPIKIQVELLRGELGEERSTRLAALAVIDRNADYVSNLVNDLRDVAKLESGSLRLLKRPLDLGGVAQNAAQSFQPIARSKSIELAVDATSPLTVEADPQRMSQVLYNFVSNALKFTPSGGRVTIHAARHEDGVVLKVADTGRGLSQEEIPRLFQPFSQVHHPGETKERGTGLGLYIAKGLVASHGGRVWVESRGHGHGSVFSAWLPGK